MHPLKIMQSFLLYILFLNISRLDNTLCCKFKLLQIFFDHTFKLISLMILTLF